MDIYRRVCTTRVRTVRGHHMTTSEWEAAHKHIRDPKRHPRTALVIQSHRSQTQGPAKLLTSYRKHNKQVVLALHVLPPRPASQVLNQ